MHENVKTLYEPHVADARRLLQDDPAIRAILNPRMAPVVLHRFLIEFSARGVEITRPVDGWIRRAGERCVEVGLEPLGKSLIKHSKHEAGHHLMLVEDTKKLVESWNEAHDPKLDADALLGRPPTPSMGAYVALHEDTIASDHPFAQVAIELEIEGMSVSFGPRLIEQCRRILGDRIVEGLSFIPEHVAVDVGHTALNQNMMERLLQQRPGDGELLAGVGSAALRAYVGLFGECLKAAQQVAPVDAPQPTAV